ncbi:cytochrome c [Actibacterium sp.]|uniref:c-type cytochrome n=1 Tax=Actibacterium sp. TaxID=1872125 RepID=UPI003562707D
MDFKIILAAGVIVAAGGAYWLSRPVPGTDMAQASATSAATAADAIVSITVPQISEDAQIGARIFAAKCATCHGDNGVGRDGKAPPLIHKIYEPGHHGDMAFLRAAQFGVKSHHWPFGDMPPVPGITQAEVGEIITYIREIQRANGIF